MMMNMSIMREEIFELKLQYRLQKMSQLTFPIMQFLMLILIVIIIVIVILIIVVISDNSPKTS